MSAVDNLMSTFNGVPGGAAPPSLLTPPPDHAPTQGRVCNCICNSKSDETTILREFGCQTKLDYVCFSAMTCVELLPLLTDKQLDREVKFMQDILGFNFSLRRKPSNVSKSAVLSNSLIEQFTTDTDKLINTCHTDNTDTNTSMISTITRLFDKSKVLLDELQNMSASSSTAPPTPPTSTFISDTVCVSKLDFKDVDISDICKDVKFNELGNRSVAYFGDRDYRYGRVTHHSCPYPNNPALDKVFDRVSRDLNMSDFNKNNYTCLFTLYENGKSDLPFHADDETMIEDDSSIITVSFGDTRDIIFRNFLGDKKSYSLEHGTVHVMTRDSQLYWEHSIPSAVSCKARVSLTFRKIKLLKGLPPVHKPVPGPLKPAPPQVINDSVSPKPRPKRLLLLTDSIHSAFPIDMFPSDIMFIKKRNFELTNIDNFKNMFEYMDYVIVSCGVNDISRHDKTGETLSNFICDKLQLYTRMYPNTIFVFNSVLSTRYNWLNREISFINDSVFKLSLSLNNLWFFDSHHIVNNVDYEVLERHHDIHITITAKKHISSVIRRCILDLHIHSPNTGYHWPLRPHFRHLSRTH